MIVPCGPSRAAVSPQIRRMSLWSALKPPLNLPILKEQPSDRAFISRISVCDPAKPGVFHTGVRGVRPRLTDRCFERLRTAFPEEAPIDSFAFAELKSNFVS